MNFKEALQVLDIEDYGERIFNSNSHGELFHLRQYIVFAEMCKENPIWFRPWFVGVVKFAEENWGRPESVFQHITEIYLDHAAETRSIQD